MVNRRLFLQAAAGTALFTRSLNVLAQSIDLIIKGGRVIDPSQRVNAIADVAIAGGRIVAVQSNIAAAATEFIDASGKLVLPGLLDVHSHYARDEVGPHVCLSDGVTGWVDGGSRGADQIDEAVAIARSAPQPARVLINIGREGIRGGGDTMELELADVDAAKAAISRNRGYIVGVKARLTEGVAIDDVEVLRRAQEVATSFDLPVMIHMGQTTTPMS
ncbi:MAG: hypothetical protein VB962_03870, partial [Pseudohongiellaceae bacterium]